MDLEDFKQMIREIIREELKSAGLTIDQNSIRQIVREEMYEIMFRQRTQNTQNTKRQYGYYPYYGHFRYGQRYKGYFS